MSSNEPLAMSMPSLAELVQRYANCWYIENGVGQPPARESCDLHDFCIDSADDVHDTYLDCTVAFAHNFERALELHIVAKGR